MAARLFCFEQPVSGFANRIINHMGLGPPQIAGARVSEDAPGPRKARVPRRMRSTTLTRNPEVPAPALRCPACDRPLNYLHTVLGGVQPIERWDHFQCVPCGFFEYRSRTRSLRLTGMVPKV
jgi:hypothetical protein